MPTPRNDPLFCGSGACGQIERKHGNVFAVANGSDARLIDRRDEIVNIVKSQQVHITGLVEQQNSVIKLFEEHMSSLRSFMEQQHRELCDRIDGQQLNSRCMDHPRPPSNHSPPTFAEIPYPTVTTHPTPMINEVMETKKSKSSSRRWRTNESPNEASLVTREKRFSTQDRLKRFVQSSSFEVGMSVVIVLNISFIFAELQWKSYNVGWSLGLRNDDAGWTNAEWHFENLDYGLNFIYLVELVLRIWVDRCRYFYDAMNVIDSIVVLVCCLQTYVFNVMQISLGGDMVRLMRLFRLLRIVKIFRVMKAFDELRILLRTLSMSVGSLGWSMVLVGCIIIAAGILMTQLTAPFIEDDEQDLMKRQSVFLWYGSAGRATYTMFEASFTGTWVTKVRPLLEDVSPFFVVFWVFYIILINFAMTRVISALFLKQTMAAAAADNDRRAMESIKEREKMAGDLYDLFQKHDTSGDGLISDEEFRAMVDCQDVKDMFTKLELTMDEAGILYEVLEDEEGNIDYEEFLEGAMKMKHGSRNVDAVQVLHEVTFLKRRIDNLGEGLKHLHELSGKTSWWDPHAAPRRFRDIPQMKASNQTPRLTPRLTSKEIMNPMNGTTQMHILGAA